MLSAGGATTAGAGMVNAGIGGGGAGIGADGGRDIGMVPVRS